MTSVKIDNVLYIPSKTINCTNYNLYSISGVLTPKNIENLENLENLDEIDFRYSDYGNGIDRSTKENVRKSLIYKKTITMDFLLNDKPDNLIFHPEYEYIKYEPGGHFIRHRDRKRSENHTHSVLFYPPQNVTGGDLVMFVNGEIINISMPKKSKWKCIIFPIEIEHASMPVVEGIKKIIKGYMTIEDIDIS